MIIGIDEAGRGPLVGCVSMGFCFLPSKFPLLTKNLSNLQTDLDFFDFNKDWGFVDDSKKISEPKRELIFQKIREDDRAVFLTLFASNKLIDKFGVGVCLSHLLVLGIQEILFLTKNYNATESQFKVYADGFIKLIENLDDDLVLALKSENDLTSDYSNSFLYEIKNDDLFSKKFPKIQIFREKKADSKYLSVAGASLAAKVLRDEIMIKLSKKYPQFGWEKNKGYGTAENLKAIEKNLDNPYLRKTFLKRFFE